MRGRILVFVVAICGTATAGPTTKTTTTAHKATVWNAQAKSDDGSYKPIVFIGDAPKDMLPACRCVTGMWKLGRRGETATHFIGTLDAASFNYSTTAKKRLSIKLRKTRELMGVHRDYRPALHGLLRRSGQVVLREVTGGEYEVIGYATDPVGKLFANNPSWKADAKDPQHQAAAHRDLTGAHEGRADARPRPQREQAGQARLQHAQLVRAGLVDIVLLRLEQRGGALHVGQTERDRRLLGQRLRDRGERERYHTGVCTRDVAEQPRASRGDDQQADLDEAVARDGRRDRRRSRGRVVRRSVEVAQSYFIETCST
jgi:hypothetical protein